MSATYCKTCNFEDILNGSFHNQIGRGVRDEALQWSLLSEARLTMAQTENFAIAEGCAKHNDVEIQNTCNEVSQVHRVAKDRSSRIPHAEAMVVSGTCFIFERRRTVRAVQFFVQCAFSHHRHHDQWTANSDGTWVRMHVLYQHRKNNDMTRVPKQQVQPSKESTRWDNIKYVCDPSICSGQESVCKPSQM